MRRALALLLLLPARVARPTGSTSTAARCRRAPARGASAWTPVNHWPVQTLATTKRWPYQVMTFVEWCGHQREVVLVPEGDGWYSEIPVLGVAR